MGVPADCEDRPAVAVRAAFHTLRAVLLPWSGELRLRRRFRCLILWIERREVEMQGILLHRIRLFGVQRCRSAGCYGLLILSTMLNPILTEGGERQQAIVIDDFEPATLVNWKLDRAGTGGRATNNRTTPSLPTDGLLHFGFYCTPNLILTLMSQIVISKLSNPCLEVLRSLSVRYGRTYSVGQVLSLP